MSSRYSLNCFSRSVGLIEECSARGHHSLVCDGLRLPFRNASFDHAISVAVVHHYCTAERRREAIEVWLAPLKVDYLTKARARKCYEW